MATAVTRADPFRYGWRDVRRARPDGAEDWEMVPLTLEDVLHPREGDHVTQTDAHGRRRRYLAGVFEAQLAGDPTAVVTYDLRIAWDVPGLRPHGPDVAVILGVRERKDWSTFDVTEEGTRPALIVEVTSPRTARLDRRIKRRHYARARVPWYVIVDTVPRRGQPPVRLLGYRLGPDGYEEVAPDERGRLWLQPVGVWLGVQDDEIVCYDEAGRPLGDYRALAAANRALAADNRALTAALAAEEQARAAAEQARAEAEARLLELEAELRRLRGAE